MQYLIVALDNENEYEDEDVINRIINAQRFNINYDDLNTIFKYHFYSSC